MKKYKLTIVLRDDSAFSCVAQESTHKTVSMDLSDEQCKKISKAVQSVNFQSPRPPYFECTITNAIVEPVEGEE